MKKFLSAVILGLAACSQSINPTTPINLPEAVVTNTLEAPTPTPVPTKGCEVIQVDLGRSARSLVVEGGRVSFVVYAETALSGRFYARVWLGGRHETNLGDYEIVKRIAFQLEPGKYALQVDVEVDSNGDGFAEVQCDRLRLEFEIAAPPRVQPEPPVPPTTPPPTPPTVPPDVPNPPDDDDGDDDENPPDNDDPIDLGLCYYEVAGRDKQQYCESLQGTFSSHDGSDHCVFGFPGISNDKLNLAPGLSAEGCLRKQDN